MRGSSETDLQVEPSDGTRSKADHPNGVTGARAATKRSSVHRLEGRKPLRCGAWGEPKPDRAIGPISNTWERGWLLRDAADDPRFI